MGTACLFIYSFELGELTIKLLNDDSLAKTWICSYWQLPPNSL